MPFGHIPAPVRRLLERSVDGVEQLEILLLLYHQAARSWDAESVGDALRLPASTAAAHLEALTQHEFLDVRIGDTMRYRYAPVTEAQAAAMRQLAAAYRDDRGSILHFVAAGRLRSLQDFSDAFRIGEDVQDG
jgi:hypothetical protein